MLKIWRGYDTNARDLLSFIRSSFRKAIIHIQVCFKRDNLIHVMIR